MQKITIDIPGIDYPYGAENAITIAGGTTMSVDI